MSYVHTVAASGLGLLPPGDPGYLTQPMPYVVSPSGKVVPLIQVVDNFSGAIGPVYPPGIQPSGTFPLSEAINAIKPLQLAGCGNGGEFMYQGTYYTGHAACALRALSWEGVIWDDRTVQQAVQQQASNTEAALRAPLIEEGVRRGHQASDFDLWTTEEIRNFLCTGDMKVACAYSSPWVPYPPPTGPTTLAAPTAPGMTPEQLTQFTINPYQGPQGAGPVVLPPQYQGQAPATGVETVAGGMVVDTWEPGWGALPAPAEAPALTATGGGGGGSGPSAAVLRLFAPDDAEATGSGSGSRVGLLALAAAAAFLLAVPKRRR